MSDAPERIFLQDAGDYARAAAFEVTWCVEPQDDADTEYIRADKVAALAAENARLRDAVALVRTELNTQINGGDGWMARFEEIVKGDHND